MYNIATYYNIVIAITYSMVHNRHDVITYARHYNYSSIEELKIVTILASIKL